MTPELPRVALHQAGHEVVQALVRDKKGTGWNEQLGQLHEKELARGNKNRATLVVARKLVEFMLAVDRHETDFELLKKAA